MPLIILIPGLIAPKLYPGLDRPDLVFPTLVKDLLAPGFVGLVMAALIAAVMSHVSGAVNSCTTIATIDIYLPYLHRGASEAQAVRFGRIVGAFAVVVGIIGASALARHGDKPVFLYLLNAYGYFTPGIAAMFLLGILWKRTTHAGAITAGLLTIPLSVALELLVPQLPFFNRTGIVFWVCMASCVAISLWTKPKSDPELAGLIWSKDSVRLRPEERSQARGLRNPVIWWAVVTAMVLYLYITYP
ncbi:MAG: hypothetical protein IT427_12970 [Pirellulales bacterium]|nr:hypothetical protein [Pirellulales bacterium]